MKMLYKIFTFTLIKLQLFFQESCFLHNKNGVSYNILCVVFLPLLLAFYCFIAEFIELKILLKDFLYLRANFVYVCVCSLKDNASHLINPFALNICPSCMLLTQGFSFIFYFISLMSLSKQAFNNSN